jgi:ferredoxin-type protein NapG
VLETAAIKVYPVKLAKGEIGAHYRLGWEEKRQAGGHSLVEDKGLVDLPDRMPEGMKLPGHFDPGSELPPPARGMEAPR